MSDANQEPTMEEILASIRRIISEDDQPQAEAGADHGDTAHAAAPAEPNTADEVLDLTNKVEEPAEASAPVDTVGDLDVFPRADAPPPPAAEAPAPAPSRPEPAPVSRPSARTPSASAPTPAPRPVLSSSDDDEGLVSRSSAESAAAAFSQLSQSLMMPAEGRSIEDVVRDLLKPMLKEWLDSNLPSIVQRSVQEEVERIARGRGR